MKTIALGLIILAFAESAKAGLVIVQEEEQAFSGRTQKTRVTLKFEGKKFRMDRDIPQFPISAINDCSTGKALTLQHHSKSYIEASASQTKEGLEQSVARMKDMGMIPEKRPRLQATGKENIINGWKAQKYTAETNFLKATYWIAKELDPLKKHFLILQNCFAGELNHQFPDLQLVPGLPVLTILEQTAPAVGKIKTTMRLLSFQEKVIPDSEFAAPPGYKKSQLPSHPVRVP